MKKFDGLKIAKQIAKRHGGRCLSVKYINMHEKIYWECADKHRWYSSLDHIRGQGTWCPYCAGKYITIEDCKKIAIKHNGRCLSNKYINSYTKMKWECKFKHTWSAILNNIKQGKWCPKCCHTKKLDGLKIAQEIAKQHGGKCLSKKYINILGKLYWECAIKHRWYARLSDARHKNSWCPECSLLVAAKKSNDSYTLYHWKTGEELVCKASYEKAVVEYLNLNKINFRWQSKTFKISNIRTYRPDMYLFSTKQWIEIKGYFWPNAKKKWDWFHKEHPNSELWDKKKLKEIGIL